MLRSTAILKHIKHRLQNVSFQVELVYFQHLRLEHY